MKFPITDQSQTYAQCQKSSKKLNNAMDEIKSKINKVPIWLTKPGLKINDQKTEICLLGTKQAPYDHRQSTRYNYYHKLNIPRLMGIPLQCTYHSTTDKRNSLPLNL